MLRLSLPLQTLLLAVLLPQAALAASAPQTIPLQAIAVRTPSLRFLHLTADDGLPSNNVTAILQDHHGFIWLGSAEGLPRFDGYHIQRYDHATSAGMALQGAFIEALTEDRTSTLWVGTRDRGLISLDPRTEGKS